MEDDEGPIGPLPEEEFPRAEDDVVVVVVVVVSVVIVFAVPEWKVLLKGVAEGKE